MNKKIRLVINITLLIIMISITIWLIINIYEEKTIQKRSRSLEEQIQANKISSSTTAINEKQKNFEKKNTEISIPLEWKGYDVSAKLEISSIKLETIYIKKLF